MNKILRLAQIPRLLEKKRNAEQEARKKKKEKDDKEERPSFSLKDKPSLKKPRVNIEPSAPKPAEDKTPQKNEREGVGDRLDLKV
jgi:hypothetical protein